MLSQCGLVELLKDLCVNLFQLPEPSSALNESDDIYYSLPTIRPTSDVVYSMDSEIVSTNYL